MKKPGRGSRKPLKKSARKTGGGANGGSPKKAAKKAAKKAPKSAPKKSIAKKTVKKAAGGANGSSPRKTAKKTVRKKVSAKKPPKKSAARKSPVKKTPAPAAKTTAAKSRRPKAFVPLDATRGFGFPADAPEIPELYGEDRLVLMAKDPEYLFAYWEITPERLAEGERAKRTGEEYREAMRLNWAARDLFDANYALLPVSLGARKWYLRVPYSGLSYQIELGWLGSQGHFIALLGSNPSDAPESWAATRRRLKNPAAAGGVLAYNLRVAQPLGSSGLPRAEKLPAPGPGDWNFGGPGSLGSSFGNKAREEKRPGGKSGGESGARG